MHIYMYIYIHACIYTTAAAQTFLNEAVDAATEGLIVKTLIDTYEPSKRSSHWLKVRASLQCCAYLERVSRAHVNKSINCVCLIRELCFICSHLCAVEEGLPRGRG